MAAPNPKRQRAVRARLGELMAHPGSVYVIHYACQSLTQAEVQGSPRIGAIAVRNLDSGVTESFSIHQEIELARLAPETVWTYIDALERAMLDRFFRFIAENRNMRFVHWNMRDLKFGFAALEHRHAVLGGEPFRLPEHLRIDLALMVADTYGSDFLPPPHLSSLATANGLSLTGFVEGQAESQLFGRGEFRAMLNSVITKVGLLAGVVQRMHDRTLITEAGWWVRNVGRVREACEMCQDNPVKALVGACAALVTVAFGTVLKLLA